MLKKHTALFTIAILTLSINIRYALYGLPLIDRWRHIPLLLKLYMILTLTDETFALEVADNHPDGEDSMTYCFLISMFDHLYWIIGVIAGSIAGQLISFNAKGIDFAMTALFVVILLDQLKTKANRVPALVGLCSAIVGLLVYPANMLIPSIVVGLIALLALRGRLENPINIGEGDTSHA
nr:AzlC family ABC transporter permease [Lentisphaeria bacterium]